jgi:hypothetical protein
MEFLRFQWNFQDSNGIPEYSGIFRNPFKDLKIGIKWIVDFARKHSTQYLR